MVEITLFSVWSKKGRVKLFATVKEALDYRTTALIKVTSGDVEEVSKIGKHPIKIEDAVREDKDA